MSRVKAKVRLSRRIGMPLTPKATKVMEKKPHKPGMHGTKKSRAKGSVYDSQLLEKQRVRFFYNIRESQLRRYYQQATKAKESTSVTLIKLLESRLDTVVLRGGLAPTIYAARQYVNHGLITVNGKQVNKPGIPLKEGDVISVKENKKNLNIFANVMETTLAPSHLEVDKDSKSITMISQPVQAELSFVNELDLALVIEHYSR